MNPVNRNTKEARLVRMFARVIGIALGLAILFAGLALAWFFFYSADLPNINALARYTPAHPGRVSDTCLGESTAIPYDAIGDNLRAALDAAEGNVESERPHRAIMSTQISRSMFCTPSRELTRQVNEARAAAQIERRFSGKDRLTIFANRVSFGHLIGVEAASEYFFHKEPAELDIAEAALLAGLVRAPSRYSPVMHPERALQRRNEVLDAMAESRTISADQAEAAKASAITLATQ